MRKTIKKNDFNDDDDDDDDTVKIKTISLPRDTISIRFLLLRQKASLNIIHK